MALRHKVTINVAGPGGIRDPVLRSGRRSLPRRLLNILFGENAGLIVVAPGDSVEAVEIREVGIGDKEDDKND
jgi:hypothetical protein